MQVISHAVAIAASGLPVFPCGSNKRPAIKGGHGFHDATVDAERIQLMFDRQNAELVGVPTGEVSGFDVLDLDYRHGAAEWERDNAYRLPETRIHQTMSGGRHLLFRHAPGVRNSASKKTLAPGVDVRGDGGYIIMPPSTGYSVIHDTEIADWPDWLLEMVLSRPLNDEQRPTITYQSAEISSKRLAGLTRAIIDRVRIASDGEKHFALRNAALSLGGIQAAAGISDEAAIGMLVEALPQGVKDWNNARVTAKWGLEHGRARPLDLADRPGYTSHVRAPDPEPPPEIDDPGYWQSVTIDAPELTEPAPAAHEPGTELPRVFDPWNTLRPVVFPLDVIPDDLRGYVTNRARIIGADPAAIAWSCICACSAAIDGRVRLQMKRHDNWSVPPAIWVALIGAPSTKKTPIIDTAWAPLHKLQARDLGHYQRAMTQWAATPKKERTEPEPTAPRRLISHDATMEALQEILSKQDRGIGVLRDELAGWIGSMEKYAPGKGGAADRAFALQSYNGGAHVVDRVTRGTIAINNLLTVICGGIQPDRLRQFGDLTDDGLWQRFVPVIVAPAGMGEDEYDAEADSYASIVHRLLQVAPGTRLDLSDAAHTIREDVHRRVYALEQSEVLGARFVGFCGKMVGLWGRLTLVLHLITTPGSWVVEGHTADAARTLLFRSVLPNAARVYTSMGGAGADIEATQSIAGYILTKRLSRIVVSDLTSNVRVCRHRSLEDVRKLLSPLEAGGWLKPEKDFAPTSWMIADQVHERFAAQAEREASRRVAVRALLTGGDYGTE